jgi:hypothetical protein
MSTYWTKINKVVRLTYDEAFVPYDSAGVLYDGTYDIWTKVTREIETDADYLIYEGEVIVYEDESVVYS